MVDEGDANHDGGRGRQFQTTHWSVVLGAGDAESPRARIALESLFQAYWGPLYGFVRRQGRSSEDAKDLTQQFVLECLRDNRLAFADPKRGRFRTFLLSAFQNFLINEWKKTTREKRGGGLEMVSFSAIDSEAEYLALPVEPRTPDVLYDERWAATVLKRSLAKLREEHQGHNERLFTALEPNIWGGKPEAAQKQMAKDLGMNEGAVRVAAHRMRKRYREIVREEIAHTVAAPEDVDDELRYLIEVVSRSSL